MKTSQVDPKGTALLLMDFHKAIVESHGEGGHEAVRAASKALEHARAHHLDVLHVVPHYRPGYPELPDGPPFDDVKAAELFVETRASDGIPATLHPSRDEPVVAKCRYSPFFANDLLHLLRMRHIHSLVLCGIATSGVVLSAVRDAWDLDFKITVLADGCADPDPEVHRVLVEKILTKQATVCTVAEWIGGAE